MAVAPALDLVAVLHSLWAPARLGQLLLLTFILLATWWWVRMERQKRTLRLVHPDIVIITQPIKYYSPIVFLLPDWGWLRWLLPYRPKDLFASIHDVFKRTGARTIGFASTNYLEVFLMDEEAVREIMIRQSDNFPKIYDDYHILRLWGENIVTEPDQGSGWKKHRALCTPAFATNNQRLVARVTVENTNMLFDKWEKQLLTTEELGEVCQVFAGDDIMRMMLYVIAGAGFGQMHLGFNKKEVSKSSKFSIPFDDCMGFVSKYLPLWAIFRPFFNLPIPSLRKIDRGFVEFEGHIKEIISTRGQGSREREEKKTGDDLLSLLLKSRTEDSRISLTDEEVFSDCFIFLLAGHETTAHSSQWALLFLATHPHEQEKLYQEIQAVLGDRDPTYEDFEHLIYTQAVFKESLRLMPPVWSLGKRCAEPTALGDRNVTPEMRVSIGIFSLHRNPKYWKDPESFIPERFDPRVSPPTSSYSFIPFSLGRRSCLGKSFAMVEGTMFLAKIAQKYTIHVPPGTNTKTLFEAESLITITPKTTVPLLLKKRSPRPTQE